VKDLNDGMGAKFPKWNEIGGAADSIFQTVLNECKLLKDETHPAELSKIALMLWGVVLCGGDNTLKAKAFYDVLQDNGQPHISAQDKDFPGNFTLIIDLATKLVNDFEPKMKNKSSSKSVVETE